MDLILILGFCLPKKVKVLSLFYYLLLYNKYNEDVSLVGIWGYHSPRLSIIYLAIVKSNVSER